MVSDQNLSADKKTDERILGIFRTIHSKLIKMEMDIKSNLSYDDIVNDKESLKKFYNAMHQIYNEIHTQLTDFQTSHPQKDQVEIYRKITEKLADFESKVKDYSKYIADMERTLKEPIDKVRFEEDYQILCTVYNDIREDEDIAERLMNALLQKK